MTEIFFDDSFSDDPNDNWGLDGWTEDKEFHLLLTSEGQSGLAYLDLEQCSRLAAALIEHVKEVRDASKENIT